jgi:DNA-binding NarL/FixJ family response regulator
VLSTTVPRRARRNLTAFERKRLAAMQRDQVKGAGRLLTERDRVIVEIYEAGASVERIGEQLGVSKESIYVVIRRSGRGR